MIKLDYSDDARRREAAALVPGMLLALMQREPDSEQDLGVLLMPFVEVLAEGARSNEEALTECLVTVLEVAATMVGRTYAQYDVDPAPGVLGFVRTITGDPVACEAL